MRIVLAVACLLVPALIQAKELTPREIYERTSPAVVMVMGHPESGQRGSGGTGSIIRPDGLVLTNAHVIVDEKTSRPFPRVTVFLKPPRVTGDAKVDLARMVKARVVAYSIPLDLALLRLDGVTDPLPTVELRGSDGTRIGDRVLAIGHPEQGGLWTLTTGVISAEVDNFNGVKGKHVFQTETGLNRGNSGGPLLDGEGRMVGVNTAIARVAADGMPITSISFSLKSAVAEHWLADQGYTKAGAIQAASPTASAAPSQPAVPPVPADPAPPSSSAKRPSSPGRAATAEPVTPTRPYNLDELVRDRSKAEADLEQMITDMRGKMKGR
jgi:serine protease Do